MSKILNFLTGQQGSLEGQVELLRAINRQIKSLEIESAQLKSKIIEQMGDSDNVVNSKGHVIATYKQTTKNTFNYKAYQADFPNEYNAYVVTSTYRTFLLK